MRNNWGEKRLNRESLHFFDDIFYDDSTNEREIRKGLRFTPRIAKVPAKKSFSLEVITMRKRERRYERWANRVLAIEGKLNQKSCDPFRNSQQCFCIRFVVFVPDFQLTDSLWNKVNPAGAKSSSERGEKKKKKEFFLSPGK